MTDRSGYRVGVLFGGRSSEHEVSLSSARNVMEALEQAGYTVVPIGISREGRWLPRADALMLLTSQSLGDLSTGPDHVQASAWQAQAEDGWALLPHATSGQPLPQVDVIFPVLHGPFGEDGTVQGLLEMANLAYVGSGVLASALGMDKVMARRLFAGAGLPQVRYQVVSRSLWRRTPDSVVEAIEADLSYPVFVKPANMGSSVGVSKANDQMQLRRGLTHAAQFDRKILVEKAVPDAREIEVSVLGNDTPLASIPGEIIPGNEFYDYDAKYVDETSQLVIPAPLEAEIADRLRHLAVQAFQVLECAGLARVDFLMDGRRGEVYLNEVNTMPGFTRISMYPKLWEASGISYPELVDRLVQLAVESYRERQDYSTAR